MTFHFCRFFLLTIAILALPASSPAVSVDTANAPRLKVGVVIAPPFINETLETTTDTGVISRPLNLPPSSLSSPWRSPSVAKNSTRKYNGIAIDIWQALAAYNHFAFDYYQVSSIPQGLQDLSHNKLDLLIGPIAITPERLHLVNFTQPYLNSYLAILVREERPTVWTILQPFLHKAAIASLIGFLIIQAIFANLLWLAEHKKNAHQFPAQYWQGIFEALWFISVTMTTVGYGDKVPITHFGRFVAFVWMWLSLLLTTSITAGLATTLTLSFSQQVATKYKSIEDIHNIKVSTIKNVNIERIVDKNNLITVETPSLQEAINLFLLKETEAVLFPENGLRYFLEQHPDKSLKVIPFYDLPINYGFAVSHDSPYLDRLNIGIAQMIEDKWIARLVNQWI